MLGNSANPEPDLTASPECHLSFVVRAHLSAHAATESSRAKAYFDTVTSEKEFHEIQGASHVGLYDIPENIAQVVEIVDTFFKKHPDPVV